ncbi:hypothetical protein [Shewanella sp. 10N.286.52.B9]|uniref:hypothetical protein n=1 Tax=Shewanella sp. 10N.286.52.B9 TaxID=1880837 RepID=UPI000C81F33D|nr:hypothetical protein [Shewanella sp. 10N.286.52.B9]PMG48060.1 hypothetical protein BCU91_02955 [Shewanella sp. 10N.286.52.B9]
MKKIYLIAASLLLSTNVAEAKFEEDLQKRCVNIVNYKLSGDVNSVVDYFYPETQKNPKFINFLEKRKLKFTKRYVKDRTVESIVGVKTITESNPKSDSKGAGFNIVEQLSVLTHVQFSGESSPSEFSCSFGREKESNSWFLLNGF